MPGSSNHHEATMARREKAFEMYSRLGMRLGEIATALGVSTNIISNDLAHMRKHFRDYYDLKEDPGTIVNEQLANMKFVAQRAFREYQRLLPQTGVEETTARIRARLASIKEMREATEAYVRMMQDLGLAQHHLGTLTDMTGADILKALHEATTTAGVQESELVSEAEKGYTVQ